MPSTIVQAFARSPHTLKDLQTFARSEPDAALRYLSAVERRLREAGQTGEADVVRELLTANTTALVERLEKHAPRLTTVFPERAADWGRLQVKRGRLLWGTAPKTPQQFVTGELRRAAAGAELVTEAGKRLKLVCTEYGDGTGEYSLLDIRAFMGEGRVTLAGMIGEDNETFIVEGAARNVDGRFDAFVEGRVEVDDGKTFIGTMRGNVEVTDPKLARMLGSLPDWQVILPGGADAAGRYAGTSTDFYALANFDASAPTGTGDTRTIKGDMALSRFKGKPIEIPAAAMDRTKSNLRHYLLGTLDLDANGAAERFRAGYVSANADDFSIDLPAPTREADTVQAVVMTAGD